MPDDLSRRVALAIEPEPKVPEWNQGPYAGQSTKEGAWVLSGKDGRPGWQWNPLPFSTDRNLLPLILAEVERREVISRFMDALMMECDHVVPFRLLSLYGANLPRLPRGGGREVMQLRYWRPWRMFLIHVFGRRSPAPDWLLDYLYPDDCLITFAANDDSEARRG